MPFLVRDVHGLSGLAFANAEPAGSEKIKAKEPSHRCDSHSCLTSDQVHVYQVRFDVSSFLWLIPQALKGETETRNQPQNFPNASQIRKLGYKRTSCNFCGHNTQTHAHLGRHTVHSPTPGRAAAQGDKRQLLVSSSAVLGKTSPAVRLFPVGASFSKALKYICTICSANISSVLITPVISGLHTKHSSTRISKHANFLTDKSWESE